VPRIVDMSSATPADGQILHNLKGQWNGTTASRPALGPHLAFHPSSLFPLPEIQPSFLLPLLSGLLTILSDLNVHDLRQARGPPQTRRKILFPPFPLFVHLPFFCFALPSLVKPNIFLPVLRVNRVAVPPLLTSFVLLFPSLLSPIFIYPPSLHFSPRRNNGVT
jgi:hypothetical protein